MEFRTQIPISKSISPIDYDSKIISIGSCFAVNMAEKLNYFKFQNTCNPFGILFHPLAIEKMLSFAIAKKQFTDDDIFFYNERWHCFDAHSDLSNSSKDDLLATLNTVIKSINQQIVEATHLIITYGTSWIYRDIESNCIVANCHKVPQNTFNKELLSVEEIEKSIATTLQLIHSLNPVCTIIFTVSPVRHIKDGFVENQRSKANIISAIHETLDRRLSTINYFPSYEIMMDELRDYRFYAEDMLHPNKVAIDYIWERFKQTMISESSYHVINEVENIQKGLAHKSFTPDSESHKNFVTKLKEKITKLENQYSFMKF
ncbi:GSCFA family protein [Flavobacterium segetis]|uniref:GSCFA family protein n=1 Tax=Flavobacterium segetis TaxID=271157 RepID=A0A1M5GVI9_9FLAO|nr:GSCFA domain-containing protein [Flavobacterium segetis]SHG07605.1 GSCFA family protein [Flavobacterium segetis]